MNLKAQYFLLGVRKTLPYQSGVLPFGVLYATIATAAGFPWWLVMFLSFIVFGGSSQLVYIDLYQSLNSAFQAVLGSNIVNARHLIYSAGVSSLFSHYPKKWRMVLSYLLTDQLYAISQSSKSELSAIQQGYSHWYFFGAGAGTWLFWHIFCLVGIFFGSIIPQSWNLGFSIPLMFMPFIFTVSTNKYAYLTCVLAVLFVILFQKLPFGLGVFFSILSASLISYLIQRKGWLR